MEPAVASCHVPTLLFDQCLSTARLDLYIAVLHVYEDSDAYEQHYNRKIFLDTIAEFIAIERKRSRDFAKYTDAARLAAEFPPHEDDQEDGKLFYKYRITHHSLCLAVRSGWTPSALLDELGALASGDYIPDKVAKLLLNEREYINAYDVVIRSRQSTDDPDLFEYWVCSASKYQFDRFINCKGMSSLIEMKTCHVSPTDEPVFDYPFAVKVATVCSVLGCLDKCHRHLLLDIKRKSNELLGLLILEEFGYTETHGTDDQILDCHLAKTTRVRDYQKYAIERVFWDPLRLHSGILVLPCGAGKTLIGISIMARIKRPTLIFCQSALAVDHWRDQIRQFTNMSSRDIVRLAGSYTEQESARRAAEPLVVITTYNMFTAIKNAGENRSDNSRCWIQRCQMKHWGLVILDEVHQVPAETFQRATTGVKAHIKLGLTATLVREDEGISELSVLVGPCLAQFDVFTLRSRGHISDVKCREIRCKMPASFIEAYGAPGTSPEERRLYTALNPEKAKVCAALIKMHLQQKRKIMVFCDDIFGLDWYAKLLVRDKVDGSMNLEERSRLLNRFKNNPNGDCLLFSKVGDQSIDLPEASVVIQLAIAQGSRMQELQRVGRVQRPSARKQEAWFYSLVSLGTSEIEYASHRRTYLEKHGYTVKIDEATDVITQSYAVAGGNFGDLPLAIQDRIERTLIANVRAELTKRAHLSSDDSGHDDLPSGSDDPRSSSAKKRKREGAASTTGPKSTVAKWAAESVRK